ncbi:endophilin-A1-like [Xyrauchen texanus]|uniref:endophilin-A1-like n=1 Tax=Xyrauchen texanus TaxID=154827 RepID=UPI0022424A8C|nr:endophilin-A1-like [Xyrauchen texanus]
MTTTWIFYHLRKLEGRRLDFDYKKMRKGKIVDSDIKKAFEKFEESKDIGFSSLQTSDASIQEVEDKSQLPPRLRLSIHTSYDVAC